MQITIQIDTSNNPQISVEQDVLSHDLSDEMTVKDLKGLVEAETGIAAPFQGILHQGQPLQDENQTLQQCRIADNSLLIVYIKNTSQPQSGSSQTRPAAQQGDPETMRLQAVGDPQILAGIRSRFPQLADVVNDRARFHEIWGQLQQKVDENRRQLERLEADPFDPDAQREIEEMIRQTQVMENLEFAMENTPEVFGRVHMLYIPVKVNGHQVKAFVDSGAQTTIMSPDCADKCGILRLLDRRYSGTAKGVGTAQILGRVHSSMLEIGGQFFSCSFTVMEGKDVDLLLGLDMLKRHRACIDLAKSKLVIPVENKSVEVSFLGEAEIPKSEEMYKEEPTIEGPEGKKIGAISGTVIEPGSSQTSSNSTAALRLPSSTGPSSSMTSGQQQQQPLSSTGSASFSQKDIDTITGMGFSRQEAIQALEVAGGNVEMAIGVLFG